ncbi:MAG: dihydropteroate synthase, partial [Nitratireductor sp.]
MPSKVTNSYLPFEPFIWHLAHGRTLTVGPKAVVMGILNVTPDSFSDGGKYDEIDKAIKQAKKMLRQGAQIIDVGGESTRPDAANVSAKEEQKRVLPIIEALSDISECIISIDTYKASTAKLAIKKGAHIVNDVWGLQFDPKMASTINALKAGCVLMHTGRQRT